MKPGRLLILCLGAGLLVWMVFTWPLPRYLATGIPTSSQNSERGSVRAMVNSDQLQLLYHYRLMEGMIAGRVPWFHNLYEFNTGDDGERFFPSAYFIPLSLVYAAGAAVAGPAFGMNLAGLAALGVTLLFTFLLVRRYAEDPAVAVLGTLVSVLVAYRWVAQLGGSPGGYAMMYVPMVFYGLDVAVRDGNWQGGAAAGVGILLACWGDVQVFFFTVLAMPGWCLVAAPVALQERRPWRERTRAWIVALSPVAVFLAAAVGYRALLKPFLSSSVMAGGRTPAEIALFSAVPGGLFSWAGDGVNSHVYIGYILPAWIVVGAIVFAMRAVRRRSPPGRWGLPLLLLMVGMAGVICLALGFNGPGDDLFIRAARKLIPPYRFVRQPARIFCLLPTLAAVACCLACRGWWDLYKPRPRRALVLAVALLAMLECRAQVRTTVCLLDAAQGAYAAAAQAGQNEDRPPRILVLPLWPGDSDWSSLYQYYVSLYGIRMVNGYSPVVSKDYFEDVFRRFESMNQGVVTGQQLEALARIGVRHLLVHEDAFPEQVSPFPVAVTLQRLVEHPRIRFLHRDGAVWAFLLDGEPGDQDGVDMAVRHWCPARRWEFEGERPLPGSVQPDAGAGGGAFLRLTAGAEARTWAWRTGQAAGLRWSIRWRGHGTCVARHIQPGGETRVLDLSVDSAGWTWTDVPLTVHGGFAPVRLAVEVRDGDVDLDLAQLAAGPGFRLESGEAASLHPRDLFHAGYSTPSGPAVHLRAGYDPHGAILYGPHLPLEPGGYTLHLEVSTPAAPGTPLGVLRSESAAVEAKPVPVRAGEPAVWPFTVQHNLPFRVAFVYAREVDMAVETIELRRTE